MKSTALPMVELPATPGLQAAADQSDVPHWIETLRDGREVLIRRLHKDDVGLEREFIRHLSPESRRLRFLGQVGEPGPDLLRNLTDLDYPRATAFVALVQADGELRQIGVSRYSVSKDGTSCECAVTVSDAWQKKGLGTLLMHRLIDHARAHGIRTMFSVDTASNWRMQELAHDLGFTRNPDPDDSTQVIHRLKL